LARRPCIHGQIVQLGRILGIIGMVFLVISIIWFLFLGVPWAWSLLGT
jgi:hypothetical protein